MRVCAQDAHSTLMGWRGAFLTFLLTAILLTCGMAAPIATADEAGEDMVPEPFLPEWHIFNEEKYGVFVN